VIWSLWLASLAVAQDCLVLTGAVAHLPDGPSPDTTLVIQRGVLTHVGPPLAGLDARPTPREGLLVADLDGEHCMVRALDGQQVTAGFVDAWTRLGLVEVSLEAASVDAHAHGGDPVKAAFRVADAYNPRSSLVPIARTGGLTSAIVVPGGGVFGGQSAYVGLDGSTQAEAVRIDGLAMHAGLGGGGGSRAETLLRLREVLDEARAYGEHREDWERARYRDWHHEPLDLEALQPVLTGAQPLVVSVNRASDIEAVLRFTEEQGVRLILAGGAEAWILAEALAEAGVPVILNPLVAGPTSFDTLHSRPDNATRLHEAGVPVVIASFGAHNVRKLRQLAGNAVREGLPHEVALAAITQTPAAVFGLGDRGVLRPGAPADVAVWTGDPLELTTTLELLLVEGAVVSLHTRQEELLDRYRSLEPDPGG